MSKVYVETFPKHKQLSEDTSDKGISVMYLKVFFHQMEITRVDNNFSGSSKSYCKLSLLHPYPLRHPRILSSQTLPALEDM